MTDTITEQQLPVHVYEPFADDAVLTIGQRVYLHSAEFEVWNGYATIARNPGNELYVSVTPEAGEKAGITGLFHRREIRRVWTPTVGDRIVLVNGTYPLANREWLGAIGVITVAPRGGDSYPSLSFDVSDDSPVYVGRTGISVDPANVQRYDVPAPTPPEPSGLPMAPGAIALVQQVPGTNRVSGLPVGQRVRLDHQVSTGSTSWYCWPLDENDVDTGAPMTYEQIVNLNVILAAPASLGLTVHEFGALRPDDPTDVEGLREALVKARSDHAADITKASRRLNAHASRRDWCGEYDSIAEAVARDMVLPLMSRRTMAAEPEPEPEPQVHTFTFDVTHRYTVFTTERVTVEQDDDDEDRAREQATEDSVTYEGNLHDHVRNLTDWMDYGVDHDYEVETDSV